VGGYEFVYVANRRGWVVTKEIMLPEVNGKPFNVHPGSEGKPAVLDLLRGGRRWRSTAVRKGDRDGFAYRRFQ
jgi:hypothetical protein